MPFVGRRIVPFEMVQNFNFRGGGGAAEGEDSMFGFFYLPPGEKRKCGILFGTETKFGHYSNTSMLRREFLVVHVLQHDCNLLSFVLFKVFPLLNGGFDADQSGNDRCIAHCWVPILGK